MNASNQQSVQERLLEWCDTPIIGRSHLPYANPGELKRDIRGLLEQKETLDRAVIALALETATGLCWCPRWYRERNPGDGYEPHHETCARIRVLVPYPATSSGTEPVSRREVAGVSVPEASSPAQDPGRTGGGLGTDLPDSPEASSPAGSPPSVEEVQAIYRKARESDPATEHTHGPFAEPYSGCPACAPASDPLVTEPMDLGGLQDDEAVAQKLDNRAAVAPSPASEREAS